ncbi:MULTISPECIES: HEAT repeat domain-containing protein [Janibacter]|uniref:HEAT repeat domain-containing protein n=1 Tax=Janibacter TaxID=53457 RepID=UPI0008394DE0|nr:HEAT repeat domain-containing protein [Janibacter terrae]
MGEVVVQPWILRLSLWILLATSVALATTIALARLTRHGRQRSIARRVHPLRQDVLALVSGEDDDGRAAERLRTVRGPTVDLVVPVLLGYLSKVRGAPAQRIVEILGAHGLVRRARAGVDSLSGARRARSVWVLGVMGVREAVADVAPRLQDRDRGVAVTAARSLGMLSEGSSAEDLLAAVAPGRRGRGELPVWVVVEALATMGPETAEVVGRALDSADASTRTVAAITIGRAQHLSQRARLRAVADAGEADPTVLAAVATALGALGNPADVDRLTLMTRDEHPRSVRLAAVRALGELGDRRAITVLSDLLGDHDPRMGELAADVLVGLGEPGLDRVREHATGAGPAAAAAEYGLAMRSLRLSSGRV